ncbi:restriction endonuclease subunit S [Flavobacterium sp. DSR3-2]|uniref:restriction endonuclease subunit S n=1 Tax=Flavobacterium sp. DSR3-2 TaxID=2804634 RepID=UPI003CFB9C1E
MINNLTKNWQRKTLGEVCEIKSGKNQSKVINPDGKYPIYGSSGIFGYADEYICDENTTIIGRKGTINSPIYVTTKFWNVDTAFGLCVKENLNSKFLYYFCLGFNFKKLDKSTTIPSLSKGDLLSIELPIPPLDTQNLIVSKIEELFSDLDKGIEDLKTAQQQLKIYRQSVLKWAFEGKLTNKKVKEGELPKGWKKVNLKEVCEVKRGKSKNRPRNAPELYGGNYPFIQTGDIRKANGGYIRKYSQTYSEIGLAQSKLWPKGTLCLTIAANIGETAILNFDACFPDSIVGLLSKEEVLFNKYLNYFFISFKQKLEELAPATAQKNINVDILEKVNLPLASFEEQQSIVQEIESRLSVADKMEESITQKFITSRSSTAEYIEEGV